VIQTYLGARWRGMPLARESDDAAKHPWAVRRELARWRHDAAFAALRDATRAPAGAKALWADVEALRTKLAAGHG
jgi:hypothetical protein